MGVRAHGTRERRLVARETHLDAIGEAIEHASAGRGGSAIVLRGPAGIGKTALIECAEARARAAGLTILFALGSPREREIPFGVVRQLFQGRLANGSDNGERVRLLSGSAALAAPVVLPEELPSDRKVADPAAALHGLFWLCSNLAERRPLLLAVDDAQWADAASLRFIPYLARRIADLPAVLLVGSRTGEEGDHARSAPLADPAVRELALDPLDAESVAELVFLNLEAEPGEEFLATCVELTGGNPFLLHELLDAARRAGVGPDDSSAPRLRKLSPRSIRESVATRLAELGDQATALAEAVAVLGARCEVRHAAELAGTSTPRADLIADDLAQARLLKPTRPLDFAHPLLRSAVYDAIPAGRRSQHHARAGSLLAAEGADRELAASHLLHVSPERRADRVELLREAAHLAHTRRASEVAVAYLRRALEEPPEPAERAEILLELGRAEASAGEPGCVERLRSAARGFDDPVERAEVLAEAAFLAASITMKIEESDALLVAAIEQLPESERELRLRMTADRALMLAFNGLRDIGDLLDELEADAQGMRGETPGERAVLGPLAWCRLCAGRPAGEAIEAAELALGNGKLLAEQGLDGILPAAALWTLAMTISHRELEPEIARSAELARAAGSIRAVSMSTWAAAGLAHARGDLEGAEMYAQDALASARDGSTSTGAAAVLSILVGLMVERGQAEEAKALLAEMGMLGDVPGIVVFTQLLVSRARMWAALGQLDAAASDLRRAAGELDRVGIVSPAFAPWRSALAAVHVTKGEIEPARELAHEELALAERTELPHVRGVALRAVALCERGEARIARLEEAVATLAEGEASLEYARALIDLGAALRRENRRGEERPPVDEAKRHLEQGIELAHRCGAWAVVERGREELRATGARPRRIVVAGLDSLTASERRVAEMAASGMSNREIAGALFVTTKTVEKHLGNCYGKLEISSRRELPAALAPDLPTPNAGRE